MNPEKILRRTERILRTLLALTALFFILPSVPELACRALEAESGGVPSALLAYAPQAMEEVDAAADRQESLGTAERYAQMRAANPDIRGWLMIPSIGLSEPIVQGRDDAQYLSRDALGEFSIAGAVFMAAANRSDFTDPLCLLHGHHMEGGQRFGRIPDYLDPAFLAANPEGILETESGTWPVRFVSCGVYAADDPNVYGTAVLRGEREALRELVGMEFTEEEQVLALSTCDPSADGQRVVLFGIFRQNRKEREECDDSIM